ncbi:hypothetical protein ACH9D2_08810 [Kocuria sp. M4R2S49]|uniref:hypothetical protein n=1 Tax=Kocuria rhizosphaericola TaxID=3376284 RepID=UPI0037A48EE0
MDTTPGSGNQLPDDPHLADDIGVPDTPARDLETAQDPLGQTNAGQRVPSAGDADDPADPDFGAGTGGPGPTAGD